MQANNKNKESIERNFWHGNFTNIRDYLEVLNALLQNKSHIECWEIITDEIDSTFTTCILLILKRVKQGNKSF